MRPVPASGQSGVPEDGPPWLSTGLDRLSDALAGQRQVADAYPDGVCDRVADRARHRPEGDLACPQLRFVRRIDDLDGHVGSVGEPEDRVGVPRRRGDPVVVEQDPFANGPARALYRSALDLVD